jgi:hypothetical protein
MGEQRDTDGFDRDDMMGGQPKDINAKNDNDRLAGLAPDPRLPVPLKGKNRERGEEGYSSDSQTS